jgi:general secretion pathway protein L
VANYLSQWQAQQPPETPIPEIWIATAPQRYAVLPGFGVPRRIHVTQRKRIFSYALLASMLLLLAGMAVTPSLQLRMRALQAIAAYDSAAQRMTSVVQEREKLVQASGKLQTLSEILNERVEPLRVIDMLTTVLPDDTAVQTLQFAGIKVTLSGHTSDTATLMQKLGQQPGIRNVRAPSAATRLNGATKENFSIEFELDPAVYGIAGVVARKAAPAGPLAAAAGPASAPGVAP